MIRVLTTIFAGLLGLAFGSFLNVCVSRWPESESVVHPGSHCRACNRTLRWWENIPLASWLALRGRCRTCGTQIGARYVLVEAAVGGLWAFIAWNAWNAASPVDYLAGLWFLVWVLAALAVLDAENLWLPDALTIPATIVGFLWWLARLELAEWSKHALKMPWGDARPIALRLVGIAAAAGIILAIRWSYWLVRRREGIGLGDAKLMALLAAWLGFPGAALSLVLAVLMGTLVALVLLVLPKRGDEAWAAIKLPLGTFLCIGGMASALWGAPLIAGYLRLVGF